MDLSSMLVNTLDLRNPILDDETQSFRMMFKSSDSHEEIDGEVDASMKVLFSLT